MRLEQPKINMLGGLELIIDGAVVDRLPTRRVAALLAYLVLHSGWQRREAISEAIWSDLPEGKALASLRNGLSVLRRILEPRGPANAPVIESSRTEARITRNSCECDVWSFESAWKSGDAKSAASHYGGDLLPGIDDDWLMPYRESLRSSFLSAVAREVTAASAAREFARALDLAERWQKCDPFDPSAAKALALAQADSGHGRLALAELARFASEYRRELGVDPALDVRTLSVEIEQRAKQAPSEAASRRTLARHERPSASESRLPIYLTRYFGRENELSQIEDWASGPSQLLTVTGMGGMGKTRLVVEAGRSIAQGGRSVLFVSLTGADSEAALISALMIALQLRESESQSREQVIRSHIARLDQPPILILDNLEQLVTPAAKLVLELLSANSSLKVLGTSREVLGIEGERLLTLAPLETPDESEEEPAPGPARHQTAVQMFVDRARNSRADFALGTRNFREVAALCRELEGLPLAIEIMAAWSGTWSVSEMRRNVQDQRVVARKRGHDPRHQSLQACIEWSFNLLEAETQEFLCVLSLFRGGWTLEAAKAVTDRADTAETLARLVDRSLVSSTEMEAGLRFSMLESVRVFCRSKLSGEAAREATPRLVGHFIGLAQELTNPAAGAKEGLNHRRLDAERENIEAVVALCEEGLADVDHGLELAGRLHLHWVYRGQTRLGITLTKRLLSMPAICDRVTGRILGLQTLSILYQEAGDQDEAERVLEELQMLADRSTDWEVRFRVLNQLGNFFNFNGRFASAEVHHREALAIARRELTPRMEAAASCNLAKALLGMGRIEEATGYLRASLEIDQALGNIAGEAMFFLAFTECLTGELAASASHLKTYLANVQNLEWGRGRAKSLEFTALLSARLGEPDLAWRLAASARAFLTRERIAEDALERWCWELIDQEIRGANPSLIREESSPLEIELAVELASRLLDSVAAGRELSEPVFGA